MAWPATLHFVIQSGSWIVLAALVAYTGGTDASAGYQVAIRNVVFFILPAWGLSNAAATLVGQNLGAKQPERAEQSVLLTMKYNAIFMAAVMLLFLFLASLIISIFTKDPEVHRFGVLSLQIIGSGYIFYGIGMVMIQSLNGAGDTKTHLDQLYRVLAFPDSLRLFAGQNFWARPLGGFYCYPGGRICYSFSSLVLF